VRHRYREAANGDRSGLIDGNLDRSVAPALSQPGCRQQGGGLARGREVHDMLRHYLLIRECGALGQFPSFVPRFRRFSSNLAPIRPRYNHLILVR